MEHPGGGGAARSHPGIRERREKREESGEEEGGRMSRTTHDATVHSGERFGVEEAANCRVIVERHLAHFQLRIHPDLKNIDLDQSLLRNRCLRETETETEGRE